MLSEDPCVICGSGDNAQLLLLCDGIACDKPYHTYCMGLSGVPEGDWFCPECQGNTALNVLDNENHQDEDYVPPDSDHSSEYSTASSLRRSRRVRDEPPDALSLRRSRRVRDDPPETGQEIKESEETNVINHLEFDEETEDSLANNQRVPSQSP